MPCDHRTLPPCEIVGRASASTVSVVGRVAQRCVGPSAFEPGRHRFEKTADPASKLQLRTAPEWNRMCQ